MQAAAADVAVGRDRDAVPRADVLDRPQRFGDPRHGHADVLAAIRALRARAQRAHRGADHRARLPQRRDSRRLVRPLRAHRVRGHHLAHPLGIRAHARRVAVDLEQQQRLRVGQAEVRPILIDRLDAALIEDLDRRRADARAKHRLDGLARVLEHIEHGQHDRPRRWDGHQLESQAGDDAERALGADDQLGQFETRRRLLGARADRAGLDHLTVGHDDLQPEHPGAGGSVLDGAHAVRVGGGHAADGCHATRARVGREDQAVRRERGVQLGVDDARLAEGLHVGNVDLEDAVHRVQRDDDAARQRHGAAGLP